MSDETDVSYSDVPRQVLGASKNFWQYFDQGKQELFWTEVFRLVSEDGPRCNVKLKAVALNIVASRLVGSIGNITVEVSPDEIADRIVRGLKVLEGGKQ